MEICKMIGHVNKKNGRSYCLNREQYAPCKCGKGKREAWMYDNAFREKGLCECGRKLEFTKEWIQEYQCSVCGRETKNGHY